MSDLDPHLEEPVHAETPGPALTGPLTSLNRVIARLGMYTAVIGLLVIVAIVFYQVFGRYVLNSSPTWTESLALILVLYVTLIAAAVGVRDAGHIGMESLLVLLSDRARERVEFVIHVLVGLFGAAMVYNGYVLGSSVAGYQIPNLHVSEAVRYVPLAISGALIVLFSLEHVIALIKGAEVEPAWH